FSFTVTDVLAVLPFHAAVIVALPPTLPVAVNRAVDTLTLPISPRSIENDAGTVMPPAVVALNCTVGAGCPDVKVTTGLVGASANACPSGLVDPSPLLRIG